MTTTNAADIVILQDLTTGTTQTSDPFANPFTFGAPDQATISVVLASDSSATGITVANAVPDFSTLTVTLPAESNTALNTQSVDYLFTMTYTSAVCGTLTSTTTQKLTVTYTTCGSLDVSSLTLDGSTPAPSAASTQPGNPPAAQRIQPLMDGVTALATSCPTAVSTIEYEFSSVDANAQLFLAQNLFTI